MKGKAMDTPRILILTGSDSDLPVMESGLAFLNDAGIAFSIDISSAHRNPEKTMRYARQARQNGYEVIIAVAGMAAHLPGVIASHTTLPVIGVPTGTGTLKGIDALLSIVQMPQGVPVATVGIDAFKNAVILACEILSIKDDKIGNYLAKMKKDLKKANDEKSLKIRQNLRH